MLNHTNLKWNAEFLQVYIMWSHKQLFWNDLGAGAMELLWKQTVDRHWAILLYIGWTKLEIRYGILKLIVSFLKKNAVLFKINLSKVLLLL